jgi:hypothetical protein
MKLIFVYWAFADQGSGLLIQGYTQAARMLGHEVAVYGRPQPRIPLHYTLDINAADAVIFIFEWTSQLMAGDSLDWIRLVRRVPRDRRVIVDGDGNYNDVICVDGDCNHPDSAASRRWIDVCDSLSDKICQPTLHPLRSNVRPFLFYSYNPAWEVPLNFSAKEFAMLYVGHSKFRWRPMSRVLTSLEPIRHRMGRLGVVGYGWDKQPPWATHLKMEHAYATDPGYLSKLEVETLPPIAFETVVEWMSKAVFNPVISRPTFNHMRLVTPRFFETPAASTIPLFGLDEAHVHEIYGEQALELVLPEQEPHEKIQDLLRRPDHYADIVLRIRRHLARHHSHIVRLQELMAIVES